MLKIRTIAPLFLTLAFFVLMAAGRAIWLRYAPPVIFNVTHSEKYGFYVLHEHSPAQYRRGMTVVFPVPAPFAKMVYGRHWESPGIPLLKRIWGLAGDRVCIGNKGATVDGRRLGPVYSHDSLGRPLPRIRGCFTVPRGYFFPGSNFIPNSFDGRYIGPVPLTAIEYEARPSKWTFSPY